MSVISHPEALGRTARRRVRWMTAAACSTAIEALAVGAWFLLVVLETRTAATALVGVGILFCGSVLRASIFRATTSERGDVLKPSRLCTAVFVTAGWVCWLLVAESIGGARGVLAAGIVLVGAVLARFTLERRVFDGKRSDRGRSVVWCQFVPAVLVAAGASALLSSVWFVDWSIASPPISLVSSRFVLHVEAAQIGFALFGLITFLAYQQRFRTALET
ncbi:hypothetical protein [Halostagnicola kamekurae]|uniref:Uncharacterized protein n=1 Tax=Halostagnicola kamekurae TaxID=619731 RepID=A0A1I6QT12_9EURY|nr:hypothetical protein [Halostagnicola kamekurae]SFS55544.1 hypothetical protein SAMN04488556_1525 [Halostagnicola kamekurae]